MCKGLRAIRVPWANFNGMPFSTGCHFQRDAMMPRGLARNTLCIFFMVVHYTFHLLIMQ